MKRRGYALLAVLWIVAGASFIALGTALAAREGVTAARNRALLIRAGWMAEGCAAQARALVDSALTGAAAWSHLDQLDIGRRMPACAMSLVPAGLRVNLNQAGSEQLRRLALALRIPAAQADSLAAALLDWRDADDLERLLGAERSWYLARRRFPPRNGLLGSAHELAMVRGFGTVAALDSLLGTEPGRIAINFAPAPVLASLPGFTDELVDHLMERRLRGNPPSDLPELAENLSAPARDSLAARLGELASLATIRPDAWILTARAGTSDLRTTLELRLAFAGNRAAIVRRRSW